MLKHLDIKIFGFVQGVGFRYYVQEKARELGLAGFVKNKADGSVYIEIEGRVDDLDKFLKWCRKGPGFARVSKINVKEGVVEGFGSFETEL